MRYAVFDLGSNSIKLLIAERSEKEWLVLEEKSCSTRLAENLFESGELKREAIERTLTVLRELRIRAEKWKVQKLAAVATSAVRDSKNRKKFLKEVEKILGFRVTLLSGNEEAETIFKGLSTDLVWNQKKLIVLDVGGGSSEWIAGKNSKIENRISLPLGCVRLRERFITSYPVKKIEMAKLMCGLRDQLQPALSSFQLGKGMLIGTGGTISTLAAIELGLATFQREKIDHHVITRMEIESCIQNFRKLSLDQLKQIPGLSPQRADLIIPGIAVISATMEILKASQIVVSLRGLRYGILENLLSKKTSAYRSKEKN